MSIDAILGELLPQALDNDTFGITQQPIADSAILKSSFFVDQSSTAYTPGLNTLASNNAARTVAVVDRGADIELAAKAIVTARFSFQGSSPYAPDLVVVNDFVMSDFVNACTRQASRYFSSANATSQSPKPKDNTTVGIFKAAESKGEIRVFGSSEFMLASIRDR